MWLVKKQEIKAEKVLDSNRECDKIIIKQQNIQKIIEALTGGMVCWITFPGGTEM